MSALRSALDYAARGWKVFPAYEVNSSANGWRCTCARGSECDRPGKHPRINEGVNGATADADQVRAWWARWPQASIGIATGAVSGIIVIDADAGEGKPGLINLTRLCAHHGGVPDTLRVNTGGGGLHLYFRFNPELRTGTNVLAEAIDVRSDGGYVIAPPSVHVSGRKYEFLAPDAPLLDLPEWMRPPAARPRRARRNPQRSLTLEQVESALAHVDPDDRDRWLSVGVILGRAFDQRNEAWDLYEQWSARSSKFDEDRAGNLGRMRDSFYTRSREAPPRGGDPQTLGSLVHWAQQGGWEAASEGIETYDKFRAIRPANKFMYMPSGALWPAESVNALLPPRTIGYDENGAPILQRAAAWLMKERGVDSVTFDPSLAQITENKVAREQGIVIDAGSTLLNRYQPSMLEGGDAVQGERWAAHVRKLFPKPGEADHIIRWCAHRVQRPGEKVRHALLIGGPPGVGKDTIFEAMLPALGAWNCAAIAPDQVLAAFNEFIAKVLVRISEVVDLHDLNRFKFFEATKTLIAGTPDWCEVNPKFGVKFFARNCCGVVMTTNHPTTGVYLPADDRRHFVVETVPLWGTEAERAAYFDGLWDWLDERGTADVAAYLRAVDLTGFHPSHPPPKTDAFWRIVAHGATSDAWLTDALEQLGAPKVVRLDVLRQACAGAVSPEEFAKRINPAMDRADYEQLRNPERKDFRHRLLDAHGNRVRVTVYIARGTPPDEVPALLASIGPPGF
jgi:hypothetical protein